MSARATFWLAAHVLLGLFGAAEAAEITIQLLFDGKPLQTTARPGFSCLDTGRNVWINCQISPDPGPEGYRMTRPEPGTYKLHVEIDENRNNPARFPGDYDVFHPFTVTADAPSTLQVDMPRLMRVTAPWDNDKNIEGMLTRPWTDKPGFDTPRVSLRRQANVTFTWEAVVSGAEYSYVVLPTRASPYERQPEIIRGKTRETTVTLRLPPSPLGHYYEFAVSGTRDGRQVGEFFTHDSGAQAWTFMFVVRDRSLPLWIYGAGALLFGVLVWGLTRLPRLMLKWAALGVVVLSLAAATGTMVQRSRARKVEEQARVVERQRAEEQSTKSRAFLQEWQQAVPKPLWWDSIPPSALAIHSLGDLLSLWQSGTNDERARRRFFKLAYQAILDHPDDEHLVPMAIHLMSYTADLEARFSLMRFGVDKFFYYKQRTDNCANCMVGDTTGQMVRDLADHYTLRNKPDLAIEIIQRLVKERDGDISDYNWALTFEALARAHWQRRDKDGAVRALQEGLRRFPKGWQADQLRQTLGRYERENP